MSAHDTQENGTDRTPVSSSDASEKASTMVESPVSTRDDDDTNDDGHERINGVKGVDRGPGIEGGVEDENEEADDNEEGDEDEDDDESGDEEDEDEDEDDEEPALKYERIGGSLQDLLKKDSASALAIANKTLVCTQREHCQKLIQTHHRLSVPMVASYISWILQGNA